MNQIKIFCPATIANLCCGFDVLGLCLEGIGDEMIFRKSDQKGIKITQITGANLPLETEKNVAGVAALSLIKNLDLDFGFEIQIHKNIQAGSGIGSSSASAAGAVFGINELLGKPFTQTELVFHAMQGEVLASGSAHADNVAPCLLGGFTLVRSINPMDIVQIPSPKNLFVAVIHPQIELKTSDMRAVLPSQIALKSAITQWGNLASLVAALYTNDYALIGRSIQDVVVEPFRGKFIPQFFELKTIASQNGALGSGIAGAGPSVFALCEGEAIAKKVANAFSNHFQSTKIPFQIHVSKISEMGCKILQN
jgi:homoserine kinase